MIINGFVVRVLMYEYMNLYGSDGSWCYQIKTSHKDIQPYMISLIDKVGEVFKVYLASGDVLDCTEVNFVEEG